ncbi:hypothetical protein [Bradyrhizobium sp. DOA9]|uniref:hypothetical protein n=1 Tax=Bradyrhizobium sp. DOA9 TaxID=1126627 RepID=UPI000469C44A|nr:hypothetical protein [Bradyrhizobium sp. DOA9]GAJ37132.1 hypothetical protein BDOA9_0163510 [Bradyrhizobium sp. DOA9]
MPLLAYFWKVGAALLALLFLADFCLPKVPVTERTVDDQPAIRIHSDRKWPERVVLDSSLSMLMTAARAPAIAEPASPLPESATIRAETPATANALAMTGAESLSRQAIERRLPRRSQHVAARSKRHPTLQQVVAARQPQLGWFGYRYW